MKSSHVFIQSTHTYIYSSWRNHLLAVVWGDEDWCLCECQRQHQRRCSWRLLLLLRQACRRRAGCDGWISLESREKQLSVIFWLCRVHLVRSEPWGVLADTIYLKFCSTRNTQMYVFPLSCVLQKCDSHVKIPPGDSILGDAATLKCYILVLSVLPQDIILQSCLKKLHLGSSFCGVLVGKSTKDPQQSRTACFIV